MAIFNLGNGYKSYLEMGVFGLAIKQNISPFAIDILAFLCYYNYGGVK